MENNLQRLEKLAAEFTQFENLVYYAHISPEVTLPASEQSTKALRIESSTIILLAKGKVHISYNFEDYDAEGPAMIMISPGTVVSLSTDDLQGLDFYLLLFTSEFIKELSFSFTSISAKTIIDTKSPVLSLRERDLGLFLRYFQLVRSALNDQFNVQLSKHIVSSLTSAIFYQSILLLYKSIDVTADNPSLGPGRRGYVHDFLRLVHMHYIRERSVNFYASQLFISPKYLSLLVKEATGKSAARWIDTFVINEAKNLLRYSGKNIQQVAYALNFSNQSSFGKYFKHLTGMSPTEFQKS